MPRVAPEVALSNTQTWPLIQDGHWPWNVIRLQSAGALLRLRIALRRLLCGNNYCRGSFSAPANERRIWPLRWQVKLVGWINTSEFNWKSRRLSDGESQGAFVAESVILTCNWSYLAGDKRWDIFGLTSEMWIQQLSFPHSSTNF